MTRDEIIEGMERAYESATLIDTKTRGIEAILEWLEQQGLVKEVEE